MGHAKLKAVAKLELLKLDLGCGKNKQPGFIGVDSREFEGVDKVYDLRLKWPWKESSVEEVHCSHFIEHLDSDARIHFVNELYRVLHPAGKATIIVPHWASGRAYGDLTHQWPPISEFWFYYLSREWREQNAAHNDGYSCDMDVTWGYKLNPALDGRNPEYQQHAIMFFKEAALDMIATFKPKGK